MWRERGRERVIMEAHGGEEDDEVIWYNELLLDPERVRGEN